MQSIESDGVKMTRAPPHRLAEYEIGTEGRRKVTVDDLVFHICQKTNRRRKHGRNFRLAQAQISSAPASFRPKYLPFIESGP
jgi:hypothetical protein